MFLCVLAKLSWPNNAWTFTQGTLGLGNPLGDVGGEAPAA